MALTAEQQIEARVWQALLVHAPADAGFVQQICRDLLQHTGSNARAHIVSALALNDDGVDACFMQ